MPDSTSIIQEIVYKLGRVESLVEGIDKKLDKHISDTEVRLEDHENKIVDIQKHQARVAGIAFSAAVVGGGLFDVILRYLPFGHGH